MYAWNEKDGISTQQQAFVSTANDKSVNEGCDTIPVVCGHMIQTM